MICKIDGRVLGGMQSGVLAQVLFWDEVLVMVGVHICKIDGRVVWGCCLGVLCGVIVRMILRRWCRRGVLRD